MLVFFSKKKDLTSFRDEELIEKFSEGDEKCFEELYQRYATLVYGTCLKYLKSEADSHDVCMDVFTILYTKLPSSNNIQSFKAWLYHVTKNECLSFIKQAQKQPQFEHDEKILSENSDLVMENEEFLTLYNEGDTPLQPDDVHAAIEQLNTEQATCIRAFYLEKKSYKDIAEETGYPLKKVKSHIQNGKRNLKTILINTKTSI
jgi:RNA polymerase sigma-70 factor (ECF subfamily)